MLERIRAHVYATPRQFIKLLVLSILITVGLGEIYAAVVPLFVKSWIGPAVVNSLLAMFILLVRYFSAHVKFVREHTDDLMRYSFAPTVAVLAICLLLGFASHYTSDRPISFAPTLDHWAWVIWIPLIEEVVFRVGIGTWFRRVAGDFWGLYCSSIVFSLVHSLPSFERIADGQIGISLGTLLLAICCEVIYRYAGRLAPIVAFHAACNFSVIIFSWLDPRWFSWLDILYLQLHT